MSSISAINSGLQGIQKGLDGIKKNAHEIATANSSEAAPSTATAQIPEQATRPKDITEPLVYMKMNQLQVEASAKVVQTNAEMMGTLIDMKA